MGWVGELEIVCVCEVSGGRRCVRCGTGLYTALAAIIVGFEGGLTMVIEVEDQWPNRGANRETEQWSCFHT